MAIDRRALLLGLGASGALAVTPFARAKTQAAFVACCKNGDGSFAAVILDADANLLFTEALDARGHDAAIRPDGEAAVVFARRPGRFALVLDLPNHRRVAAFSAPDDRHFCGHGFFSGDGRLLFATENDFEQARGVLGVYDVAAGYRRIGELDSGGVGPHEALLLRDGHMAIIANGGIATHPDYPRQKLNLANMAPSIAVVDIVTGEVAEIATLPPELHQLSIRHMAAAGDGTIWFGGQYEGPAQDAVPLVGRYRPGGAITLIDAPPALYRSMRHYIGSVAVSRDGARIATTSPRGGRAIIWDAATRTPIESRAIADVCGAAPAANGFVLSDGQGGVRQPGGERMHPLAWDNHLTAIAMR